MFFYPLLAWFSDELKAGRFPLWTPYIFAGYPVFADGESGLANPLVLALVRVMPVGDALLWLRVGTVAVAAGSMFAFCRALGVGALGALVGGACFAFGSFFPSQQHHENVTRTAAWLPLVLACVEWGLHRTGWRRHAFFTIGALALGMAAVGLHPQILAMTLIGFATFVVYRCLIAPPPRDRDRTGRTRSAPSSLGGEGRGGGYPRVGRTVGTAVGRLLTTAWVGLYVGGLGLALGAVQLLPLADLATATYRGSQPNYFFATSYALPPPNLIDLIFPYFFRLPNADYWSLWAKWETELYVGIAPLVLGVIAVVVDRRRVIPYFLILAIAALWLAFASYAPLDLYHFLWDLPGLSAFRVPGRYTYLFVLGWSVLAAFGFQTIADLGTRRRDGSSRFASIAVVALLAIGAGILLLTMHNLRLSLASDQSGSIDWINRVYLSMRHHLDGLPASEVYQGLLVSLDPATPRTAFGVVLLAASFILVIGAVVSRRTSAFWRLSLAGLVVGDLLAFGSSLHSEMPISRLGTPTAAMRFLAGCGDEAVCRARAEGQGDAVEPPWRVYTSPPIDSLEFNQLVPFRIADIGGYASPDLRRNFAYWTDVDSIQNQLADLANVRFVAYPGRQKALPSYGYVPYDPEHPLMLGSKDAVGGFESYSIGGARGNRVLLIADLTRAIDVPQDTVVAELTVVPREGAPIVFPVRAGRDVAEAAYDRPDVRGKVQHAKPDVVAFQRPDVYVIDGSQYQRLAYYSERDLPNATNVDRIEIRYVYPAGGIEVYGLGLFDFESETIDGVTPDMRTKLRLVYRDDDVRIYENRDAYPRAYVVPRARIAVDPDNPLGSMQESAFDPAHEVMLVAGASSASGEPPPSSAEPLPQAAQPVFVSPNHVVYRASAPSGGYFVHVANDLPGWRAFVDGQEAPVLLANALFRAVPLPPGDHTVELRYEPLSVELGLRVSILALLVVVVSLILSLVGLRLQRSRGAAPRSVASDGDGSALLDANAGE